ncbi:ATP-dependent DNA helicase PcrA [Enterocloster clostridioformis]|uniref:ATP-dependent helicase n=1 Tax=Enterocloster clostridioformis TaxID=1531 RepID=UPI00080CBB8F|nr:UvrD-helicase domain-containing protein [Enterocloster clostridioformis]ANU48999.1 ATP-dependent DNA helicase PcrA [Lachnoclostridium sp. YL32]NDO27212.1 AAA family ATPase [Enterocloster clostridioformis]OXE62044.1 ATP-dependent DNA helicase PcrA [Enterocloster clostridioformis]QQR02081.1 UvrD-helicase domain-containing protein [Enterocloster clostridioformis]
MSIYDALNPMQKEAVLHTEGPLLILAGAGSGKTRVLTHRVAYLIDEKQVNPWNILAITFTNKAAGEMRERVDQLVGFGAESIWVSTFHSTCVRILRRHIEYLGYTTNFSIYDSDDQKTLMKQVFKAMDVDTKQFKERSVLGTISSAKDKLIGPEEFLLNAGQDFRQRRIGEIYKEYQKRLRKNNALDFDDLIVKTVELFQNNSEILNYYQDRFKYIMVDEYQDTNLAQFKLISLLASKYRNLCVVGDDDQSIYRFRGADIGNILSFEETFPGAKVIKLEQNYRSTQNILNAANGVIRHNRGRKDKTLWTANGEGDLIRFKQFDTAREEADFVAREIRDSGYAYQDQAVLYRTNAQSRLLEERCIFYNVPYRLVGGVNFYQRKEIKDILAYLKTIANGVDDLSVLRIINVPKRGIGATTMGKVTIFASEHGMSLYDALREARQIPGIGKAAEKIGTFIGQMESFRARAQSEDYTIQDLIEGIMDETGYQQELEAEGEVESQTRLENIEELVNKAVSYEEDSEHPTLDEFLEQVALVADIDNMDESENRVTLMTLHSAKGLEFPKVYLVGLEDGLFPSMMSINSDDKTDMEEERRLCYVGITRAKNGLVITSARQRMVNGETRYCKPSRFLEEVPGELLEEERLEPVLGSFGSRNNGDGAGGFGRSGISGEAGLPWNQPAPGNTRTSTFGKGYNAYASGASQPLSGLGAGSPAGNPGFGKAFTVQKAASLDYGEGDRVRHIKFGEGTVKSIRDGGKDYEVTVVFDGAGQKKMFASFAKLKKV